MPYFRYFGPTAIVPGLRQMVVKVRGKQHGSAQTTSDRTYIPCAMDLQLVMRLLRSIRALVAKRQAIKAARSLLLLHCSSVSCS
jgi:hypothetical protein